MYIPFKKRITVAVLAQAALSSKSFYQLSAPSSHRTMINASGLRNYEPAAVMSEIQSAGALELVGVWQAQNEDRPTSDRPGYLSDQQDRTTSVICTIPEDFVKFCSFQQKARQNFMILAGDKLFFLCQAVVIRAFDAVMRCRGGDESKEAFKRV